MDKLKIAFIINPKSGTSNKKDLPDMISSIIDKDRFDITVVSTEYAGHGRELSAKFASEGYACVVACGGDGTMNEVASSLINTQTHFAIVPYGSGNGFARHLGISMAPKEALYQINEMHTDVIDYGEVDGKPFFCTCGTGFDAHISHKFAEDGKRGFITYLKTIVKEFINYKPQIYTLRGEGFEVRQQAFLVTFANANQYGNNGFIAPHASMKDGLLDICILKPFKLTSIPRLTLQLFKKEIDKNEHISIIRASEVTLERNFEGEFHIDGDPTTASKEIHVRIVKGGLKVVLGKAKEL